MLDIIKKDSNREFYDSFFSDFLPEGYDGKLMRVDIRENDYAYYLDVEVPGVKKENIKLITNDDILTINIKREESNNDNYIRRERKLGSMSRSFTIREIDKDNISAKYSEGMLYICIPKLTEEDLDKTRTINID